MTRRKINPNASTTLLGIGIGFVVAFGAYLVMTEVQPKPRKKVRKKTKQPPPEATVEDAEPAVDEPAPPPAGPEVPPEEEPEAPPEEAPAPETRQDPAAPTPPPPPDPEPEAPDVHPVVAEWAEVEQALQVDGHVISGAVIQGPFTGYIRVYRLPQDQKAFVGAVVGVIGDEVMSSLTDAYPASRDAWDAAMDLAATIRDQMHPEGHGQPPDHVEGPKKIGKLQT